MSCSFSFRFQEKDLDCFREEMPWFISPSAFAYPSRSISTSSSSVLGGGLKAERSTLLTLLVLKKGSIAAVSDQLWEIQLLLKGFKKVDPDKWEFANEGFLRAQRHLLKTIKRRKSPSHPPQQQSLSSCLDLRWCGLDAEMDRLKRDNNMLMEEVIKLRQQHQNTRTHIQAMVERLQVTEQKQQHMMFLTRAMQNPNFLQKLVEQQGWEKAITKRRRRVIDNGPDCNDDGTSAVSDFQASFGLQCCQLSDSYEYEVTGLESIAVGLRGLGNIKEEEHQEKQGSGDGEVYADFWEELGVETGEDMGSTILEGIDDNANVLSEKSYPDSNSLQ